MRIITRSNVTKTTDPTHAVNKLFKLSWVCIFSYPANITAFENVCDIWNWFIHTAVYWFIPVFSAM